MRSGVAPGGDVSPVPDPAPPPLCQISCLFQLLPSFDGARVGASGTSSGPTGITSRAQPTEIRLKRTDSPPSTDARILSWCCAVRDSPIRLSSSAQPRRYIRQLPDSTGGEGRSSGRRRKAELRQAEKGGAQAGGDMRG